MLPKTVLDATIVYTFDGCSDDKTSLNVKITPTLTPRTIPDPLVDQMGIDPHTLESFWQDGNITIQTFSGSRILNSIGSSPTSQVGQIGGNILGGLAKIVGVFLGVPAAGGLLAKTPSCPEPTPAATGTAAGKATAATTDTKPERAIDIFTRIDYLKNNIIKKDQNDLADGVDEATQKKDTAAIQAAQTLISTLQNELTITIKTTIDPGVSPVDVDPNQDKVVFNYPVRQSADPAANSIANSGLIATFCPSIDQLKKANWLDPPQLDTVPPAKTACDVLAGLKVNVYLDFPHGHGTMYGPDHPGLYQQTVVVPTSDLYRDVAYIPVLVWRGTKDGQAPMNMQLTVPQMMPFGQFGVAQSLPINASGFKSLIWSITFLENGEITNAIFTSKASGINASALLGSATSAASSIITEQSPSSQASGLQGQADLIYQTQRLALCQADPKNCPSK